MYSPAGTGGLAAENAAKKSARSKSKDAPAGPSCPSGMGILEMMSA